MSLNTRYATLVVAAVSIVALSCVAFLVPVPYTTLRPGPTFNTLGDFDGDPMFEFGDDVKTHSVDGRLDFTTVNVSRADAHVTFAEAAKVWLTPNAQVVPDSSAHPDDESEEGSQRRGEMQLSASKQSSQVAALRSAGYTVAEHAEVVSVADDGAAAGKLKKDDEIVAVEDTRTDTSADVVDAVSEHDVGDRVSVRVRRDGDNQEDNKEDNKEDKKNVRIKLGRDPDDSKKPRIGITVGRGFDLPVKITNNVGEQIGGPSAGLMFALAIYDRLESGSLTGGAKIAGTGEVSPEGEIGPIGGVRQKMAGAHQDGAAIFLVPSDNCDTATDGDDFGMRLIRVSTLDEAIDSLEKLADDPKASVPTC